MKILRLTPAQQSFVEIEIIGRYSLDEDEDIRNAVDVISEHFFRRHTLAVPDPELVHDMVLQVVNDIDDAIDSKSTFKQGYGTPQQARYLHRTGNTLLRKLRDVPGWWGHLGMQHAR